MPKPHDVVLSRRCNPGETAWVPPDFTFALGQNLVLLRASGHTVYPPFLRWLVRSPEWWSQIQQHLNAGAVFDSLKCADIPKFTLPIPSFTDQRAIAGILGALDDKIELNRKMSATLEAMARALFKSWFVDFDPVRAKAEGRDTGLAPEIAALFPDSFEDSELGKIPAGWNLKAIAEVAFASRATVNPLEFPGEIFEHYSIPAYDINRGAILERGASIKSSKFLVLQGTVLLSRLNPRTPRVVMPSAIGQRRAICSTEFAVMRPKIYSKEWLYCLFFSEMFCDKFATMVTGTSGSHQRVKPESLLGMLTVAPSERAVEIFTEGAGALLARIAFARTESLTLTLLRDALLPKLISGEIRITDAEHIVEKSA